jgi:histone H3/H4
MPHGRAAFPTGLLRKRLRNKVVLRVGPEPAVYLGAVFEYLTQELLSGAAAQAKKAQRKRINQQDIRETLRADPDLNSLFGDAVLRMSSPARRRRRRVKQDGVGTPLVGVVDQAIVGLDDLQVYRVNASLARMAALLGVPLEAASYPHAHVGGYAPLPPGACGHSLQVLFAPPNHWVVLWMSAPYHDAYIIDTLRLNVLAHTRQVPSPPSRPSPAWPLPPPVHDHHNPCQVIVQLLSSLDRSSGSPLRVHLVS